MKTTRIIAALACTSLLGVGTAVGQVESYSTTVELTQIPVTIISTGTSFTRLQKENFEVYVDGAPATIEHVDFIDHTSSEASGASTRELFVFVFDLVHSRPATVENAKKAVLQTLDTSLHASELFSIATYSSKGGLQVVVPFTSNVSQLRHAAQTLETRTLDPFGIVVSPTDGEGGRTAAAGSLADTASAVGDELERDRRRHVVRDQLNSLVTLAQKLAAVPGRKHVVLLTEGFHSSLVYPPSSKASAAFQVLDTSLLNALRNLHTEFVKSHTLLHTADVRLLRHTFNPSELESLALLSADTGGRVIKHENNLVRSFTKLRKDFSAKYVLSLRAVPRADSTAIKVNVLSLGRNVKTVYPRQLSRTKIRATDRLLQLADVVMNGTQFTTTIAPTVSWDNAASHARIQLDGREILRSLRKRVEALSVFVYVFNEAGSAVAFRQKRVSIDAERAAKHLEDSGIAISERLQLTPGSYKMIVVVARDDAEPLGLSSLIFPVFQSRSQLGENQ